MTTTETDPTASGEIVKLTVNVTARAIVALNKAADRCGESHTDAVSRALILYGELVNLIDNPRMVVSADLLDGEEYEIRVTKAKGPGR
jgi:hypothetical protein